MTMAVTMDVGMLMDITKKKSIMVMTKRKNNMIRNAKMKEIATMTMIAKGIKTKKRFIKNIRQQKIHENQE